MFFSKTFNAFARYVGLRRTPLARRTPLSPGKCTLKRGNLQRTATGLLRKTKLRQCSAKRAIAQAAWNALRDAKILAGLGCARCGVKDSPTCRLHGHHFLPRGRGGADTSSATFGRTRTRFDAAKAGLLHSNKVAA